MLDNLIIALNAVVPLLCYILLGTLTKARGLATKTQFRWLNKIVFRSFFIFVMFNNTYKMDFSIWRRITGLVSSSLLTYAFLVVILLLVVPRLVKGNPQRGALLQGLFRSNILLFAIPLAESVFGKEGSTMASLLVTFMVPLYNVTAVFVLEYFQNEKKASPGGMLVSLLTNPLLVGAVLGLLFAASPLTMPRCLETPITRIADMGSPLALFALGGTLKLSSVRRHMKYLVPAMAVKLVVYPGLILGLTQILHMDPIQSFTLFALYGTPVATSTFPMAQEMGADVDLAGELVVVSTLLSVLTIFLWIFAMKNVGVF